MSDKENATPNDDNICNDIRNGLPSVVTVTCNYGSRNPPLRGCYVTIRRKDKSFDEHLLNFCEVVVLSCHPGRWGKDSGSSGDDCSRVCDKCRNISETCRVSDGLCYTGCRDGYWGRRCDKQCHCQDGDPCGQNDGLCQPGKYFHYSLSKILKMVFSFHPLLNFHTEKTVELKPQYKTI